MLPFASAVTFSNVMVGIYAVGLGINNDYFCDFLFAIMEMWGRVLVWIL